MALGKRVNLATGAFTAGGGSIQFTADRDVYVRRMKFYPDNGIAETDEDLTITCEGELLYGGTPLNIPELAIPSGQALLSEAANGPWVLTFDKLIKMNKTWPITITPSGGATSVIRVVLEGP